MDHGYDGFPIKDEPNPFDGLFGDTVTDIVDNEIGRVGLKRDIVDFTRNDNGTYATQLFDNGYVVIPCITKGSTRIAVNFGIEECMDKFQEFTPYHREYEMNGSNTLANPSSFHNKLVRDIRSQIGLFTEKLLWKHYIKKYKPGFNIEQIIDGLMVRFSGSSTTQTPLYRDKTILAEKDDDMFCGGLNLNVDENHIIYICPKSHKDVLGNTNGPDVDESLYRDRIGKLIIPPGHLYIMFSSIVRMVPSIQPQINQYRLFMRWRITKCADKSIIPLLQKLLTAQDVIPLPSGHTPQMYGNLPDDENTPEYKKMIENIITFTKNNIKPYCTQYYDNEYGKIRHIVPQVMNSLTYYKTIHNELELYPKYTYTERMEYIPHNVRF